jgi:monovalent cation/hydrogen antiporter
MMHLLFARQRERLTKLRNEGRLSNQVMHRLEREIDLEESRLEV